MIQHKHKFIWGLVLAVIVFGGGWFLRARERDDQKNEFVAEISQFARFTEFEDLLLGAVERKHKETYRRHLKKYGSQRFRVHRFDHSAYREDMYSHVIAALKEPGHANAASELRRFRKSRDSAQPGRSR